MQILQDFPVRLEKASLAIRDRMRAAELFSDFLGLSQSVARHAREEVMLDLIIQPARPKVEKRMAFDVAGGQHLAAQKIL